MLLWFARRLPFSSPRASPPGALRPSYAPILSPLSPLNSMPRWGQEICIPDVGECVFPYFPCNF